MRVVIDTNDFISALIGKKHRDKLTVILANPTIELIADENLLTELSEVAHRGKFKKYVTPHEVDLFLTRLKHGLLSSPQRLLLLIVPTPDDNYLLSIAIDSQAQYLITGDKKHLLALSPYQNIQIIRLQALIDVLSTMSTRDT